MAFSWTVLFSTSRFVAWTIESQLLNNTLELCASFLVREPIHLLVCMFYFFPETCLETDEQAQLHGVVFLCDCQGLASDNFSFDAVRELIHAFRVSRHNV